MSNDILDFLKINFENKYTPEYMEQLSRQCYKEDREYPENFSNWYPHIKEFGKFKHSNIIAHQIFTYEELKILQKYEALKDVNWEEYEQVLKPTLDKLDEYKLYNIKNGCFSNKFEFNTCITTKQDLAKNFWKIEYSSACYDTGGHTELVVREYIPYDISKTLTIYNGMPLRTEVRIFYNMLTQKIEYIEDYWNYDYCIDNIHNITDNIVFSCFHNNIVSKAPIYTLNHSVELDKVINYIKDNIHTLQFDNTLAQMYPIWSIDFMYDNCKDDVYLIDMARGYRSAYWDPNKLNKQTLNMLKSREENN